jgi:hypothetical protein
MIIIPNLTHLPFGGAESIYNPTNRTVVENMIAKSTNDLFYDNIHRVFVNEYRDWINSTKINNITGLDNFPFATYSNGTTETFDKFYLKYHNRRFRCFKGEYMYQMACGRNYCSTWKFLDDEPVAENDAVVISLPFSDLGNEHPMMKTILNQCELLSVPVLIDCAFFGLCSNVEFDLTHPAITEVTFSLSKFFPVANLRIGIRFSKEDTDDTLFISHKHGYVNRIGASVGVKIFEHYSPDYNVLTYKKIQEEFCEELDLIPSSSVIFGIDTKNLYPEYNRGYISNRLCFSKYMYVNKLPD